jgi:hypothetical protein
LEPFVLRALGLTQSDQAFLKRARERFTALGLGWHAAQTPLVSARASAHR